MVTTFLVLLAGAACCDTYKWEDKNGIHFTDNPERIPQKYKSKSIAEAREDIKGVGTQEFDSSSTGNIQPNRRTPALDTDNAPDKQARPLNFDTANDGMKTHNPQNRHQNHYGNKKHRVKKAHQSAYESQSPARKAMNQAEEKIRQTRQALDSGGRLPPKQK